MPLTRGPKCSKLSNQLTTRGKRLISIHGPSRVLSTYPFRVDPYLDTPAAFGSIRKSPRKTCQGLCENRRKLPKIEMFFRTRRIRLRQYPVPELALCFTPDVPTHMVKVLTFRSFGISNPVVSAALLTTTDRPDRRDWANLSKTPARLGCCESRTACPFDQGPQHFWPLKKQTEKSVR